jgi:hypothetical protein
MRIFFPRIRTVRTEPHFDEQLSSLGIDVESWVEVFGGLEFVIARNPELFPEIDGTHFHVATIDPFKDLPELSVLYTHDNDYVYLVDIYLPPVEDDEE